MAHLLRLIAATLLLALAGNAAALVPIAPGPSSWVDAANVIRFNNPVDAGASYWRNTGYQWNRPETGNPSFDSCSLVQYFIENGQNRAQVKCTKGETEWLGYAYEEKGESTCPANSTSVSQTHCQCNTGSTEVGGQCVALPAECTAKRGQEYSPESSRPLGTGATLPLAAQAALLQPIPSCVDKCAVGGGSLRAERSLAQTWTLIVPALNYTGGSCTGTPGDLTINTKWDNEIIKDAEPPVPCSAGKMPGTINGVSVCMPSGATASASTSSSSSSGTSATTGGTSGSGSTNGDGSGSGPSVIGSSGPSNSSDTTITTCDGKTCTTTTSSTSTAGKPSGGVAGGTGTSTEDCAKAAASSASAAANTGATCTNTTTTTKPQGEYCKENPKKPECVNDDSHSSFGGNCTAGFTATGDDAVTNAMAKEIYAQNCKMNPDANSMALAIAAREKTGNQTTDNPNNSSFTMGASSFDTSDALNAGGSCITDKSITVVGGFAVTLPLSKFCTGFEMLGAILLACSFLAAAVIVMRG